MGADRVIFGSDWPHIEGMPAPARLRRRAQGARRREPAKDPARQRARAQQAAPGLRGIDPIDGVQPVLVGLLRRPVRDVSVDRATRRPCTTTRSTGSGRSRASRTSSPRTATGRRSRATHGLTIDQLTDPNNAMRRTSIIMMDPPDHDRMRKLVSRVFTPRAVTDLEPLMRDVVRSFLAPLEGATEMDLSADFAGPFPVEVISRILGVPAGDRQQIRHWTDEMLHREPNDPRPSQAGMDAGMHQVVYFLELIKEKRDASRRRHDHEAHRGRGRRRRRHDAPAHRRRDRGLRDAARGGWEPRPSRSWSATGSCSSTATPPNGRRSSTTPAR